MALVETPVFFLCLAATRPRVPFVFCAVLVDVVKQPYITVGFTCFVLLIPLAVTSTNAMQRRLGGKRWQQLHRLVYLIAAGGVAHYLWLVKKDLTQPLLYGLVLCVLLGMRFVWRRSPPGRAGGSRPQGQCRI